MVHHRKFAVFGKNLLHLKSFDFLFSLEHVLLYKTNGMSSHYYYIRSYHDINLGDI